MCDALDIELGGVTAFRELDAVFEGPASAMYPLECAVNPQRSFERQNTGCERM